MRDNKKQEIARLNGIYDRLLANVNADVMRGRARITGPNEVEVNGRRITAAKILIATGGWPRRDTRPGTELGITSNEIFDLETFPKRILIAGGGYIAVEFAGIFNGLGADVVQLYRGPLFLRGFDQDIREFAAHELPKTGIDLRFEVIIDSIERAADGGLRCQLSDGSEVTVDQVLYAIGREPLTKDLGLENVGVRARRPRLHSRRRRLLHRRAVNLRRRRRHRRHGIDAGGAGRGHGVRPQAVRA